MQAPVTGSQGQSSILCTGIVTPATRIGLCPNRAGDTRYVVTAIFLKPGDDTNCEHCGDPLMVYDVASERPEQLNAASASIDVYEAASERLELFNLALASVDVYLRAARESLEFAAPEMHSLLWGILHEQIYDELERLYKVMK